MNEQHLSVSEFNQVLNLQLGSLGEFVIDGEITQLNVSQKGGVNIVLKDPKQAAVLNLSGYAPRIQGLNMIKEGMQVAAWGTPQIYAPLGKFSLTVYKILPLGAGQLQAAYLKLKQNLAQEGLFSLERKRQLPTFVSKIALVTAANSAALSDFCKILQENQAGFEIDFYPVQVQGKHAEQEILQTLKHLNSSEQGYDCIVLIRGGGSLEDLLTFNSEKVARAIFAQRLPVLVGVGHERDESIADFVADIRASTPSQAAYYLSHHNQLFLKGLDEQLIGLGQNIYHKVREKIHVLEHATLQISNNLQAKTAIVNNKLARLEFMVTLLPKEIERLQESVYSKLRIIRGFSPLQKITTKLALLQKYLSDYHPEILITNQLQVYERLLYSYNPKQIMRKGYAIIHSDDGKVVKSAKKLHSGNELKLNFHDGEVGARVK